MYLKDSWVLLGSELEIYCEYDANVADAVDSETGNGKMDDEAGGDVNKGGRDGGAPGVVRTEGDTGGGEAALTMDFKCCPKALTLLGVSSVVESDSSM